MRGRPARLLLLDRAHVFVQDPDKGCHRSVPPLLLDWPGKSVVKDLRREQR